MSPDHIQKGFEVLLSTIPDTVGVRVVLHDGGVGELGEMAVVESDSGTLSVAVGLGGERIGEIFEGGDGPGGLLEVGDEGAALTVGEQG